MISRRENHIDYPLFIAFAIWLLFGLAMLASAGAAVGQEKFGDTYFFIKNQLLFGLFPGICLCFLFCRLDYRLFRRFSSLIFVVTTILLLSVFIPGIGTSLGTGSQSWIHVGGLTLQPSELGKLGLILFFSGLLIRKSAELRNFKKGFLPTIAFGLVPSILVVLQGDLGTMSILFVIFLSLLFLSDAEWKHILLLFGLGAILFGVMILTAPYRAARLTIFLHPELDPQGYGYQVNQAKVAVGSGGLFGLGYHQSRQKFQYLPEVHADSIFAIIAEEMGFFITTGFLLLLLFIGIRGFRLAKQTHDAYARLVVVGVMTWFLFQSFLNIGSMVGLLPLTGIPLPFVSHGGTALAISLAAVGILYNINRQHGQ